MTARLDSLRIVALEQKQVKDPKTNALFDTVSEGVRSEYTRETNIHFGLPLCQVDDEEADGFLRAVSLYRGNYEVPGPIADVIGYFAALACSFGQFYGTSEKALHEKMARKELPFTPDSLEAALAHPIAKNFFGLRRVSYLNAQGLEEKYIMPIVGAHR